MTAQEFQFKPGCIILGIFNTEMYYYLENEKKLIPWSDFRRLLRLREYKSVLETIQLMAHVAPQIAFVLDDIYFPINPNRSTTCGESEIICSDPQLFEKTVFFKNNQVINFDKNLVI